MTDRPRADELLFLPLGGCGEIGMNLSLYGHAGKWLMVDLGITFGNESTPGIDVIMPDPSFIVENRADLLGLVLTHAHEDHIGAVPYLWPRLRCPIYATPFTAAVLRRKLAEANLLGEAKITEIPMSGSFALGPFEIELISITHSIPEPNAVVLRTPAGQYPAYRRLEARSRSRHRPHHRRGGAAPPGRGGGAGHGLRFHQCPGRGQLGLRGRGAPGHGRAHRPLSPPRRRRLLLLQCRAHRERDQGRPRPWPACRPRGPLAAPHGGGGAGIGISPGPAGFHFGGGYRSSPAGACADDLHRKPGRAALGPGPHRPRRASRCRPRARGCLHLLLAHHPRQRACHRRAAQRPRSAGGWRS